MPIFQDDDDELAQNGVPTPERRTTTPPSSKTPSDSVSIRRKLSEESIRTELCEGPLPDSLEEPSTLPEESSNSCFAPPLHGTTDRLEYIERLKRGESPSWPQVGKLDSRLNNGQTTLTEPLKDTYHASSLLPSPEFSNPQSSTENENAQAQIGLQIERPRSALHSGDFTERTHRDTNTRGIISPASSSFASGENSWLATSPPRNFSPFQTDSRFSPRDQPNCGGTRHSRVPSLSSSYSSSFIFKPPTSPLVQSESNDDLAFMNPIDISPNVQRNSRRHTLHVSHSFASTSPASSYSRAPPQLRRDSTYPYQAHQPRRSLTSNSILNTPAQTPDLPRARRPSCNSDNSPLHASMVGSYEESILRGRMSTTPSKPLDFVAQIGVLGLGKCKASLRCPAHVTLPFPAVFYSYGTTNHGRVGMSEDGPSPYVGLIDLENGLPNTDEGKLHKRKRTVSKKALERSDDTTIIDFSTSSRSMGPDVPGAVKPKRRSASPRAPPGGSYRIPEKGQLQIIIKNPNKTAVKLFLVPYDLAGMEPGTKTFIRQRSYSVGDSVVPTSSTPVANLADRQTLRYLAHLHICSPSRGRFYLYKSIRIVFANRVPDGKEKLRNEISIPEPRFTVYRPGRDSTSVAVSYTAGAGLAAENAFRRRSSGFALGLSHRSYDAMEGITQALRRGISNESAYTRDQEMRDTLLVEPIPFSTLTNITRLEDDSNQPSPVNILSPTSSRSSLPPTSHDGQSTSWDSNSSDIGGYSKLSKGDAGYGGNLFSTSPDGKQQISESLLARKLRNLGLEGHIQKESPDDM